MSFKSVITLETGLCLAPSASNVKDEAVETSMARAGAMIKAASTKDLMAAGYNGFHV